MLAKFKISSRLMLMVVLSVLGIASVAGVGLSALKSSLLEDRKDKLQQLVLLAKQVLELDYQGSRAAGLSDAQALERSKQLLQSLRFGKDDYFYALDMDSVLVAHPNPKFQNKSMKDTSDANGVFFSRLQVDLVKSGGSGFVAFSFPRAGVGDALPKIAYVVGFKPYDWAVAGGIYLDDVDAIFMAEAKRIGLLILIALALVVATSILLSRSITRPIASLTRAMRKLASGDTRSAIPALSRADEVGEMATTVKVFQDAMIETARLRQEQDEMKLMAETEKRGLLGKLADEFAQGVSTSLDALFHSASAMRTTSQGMSETARSASRQSGVVATAAEEASSSVQSVASATEQLSASIAEIGNQVARSTKVAGGAVEEAQRTNITIQGLVAATSKIGDVVQLITAIASQTNLLALNATIEAARAGEAGRGFAVVASEVKSLAGQTARATEEISTQVNGMRGAMSEAVQAIEGVSGTISSINEIAIAIASAVEQQGVATREIARSIQQVAQGTEDVSRNIVGVSEASAQTGVAAADVLAAAGGLNHQSTLLKADVDRFLASVRAA
ncbi:cache domain-containing protein [Bradyrhizobium sp. 49]|uniref:methyl-accepting chemotaxis protein n=1 Tax=unclassified Bradyrhizobium TaxID=2631580 RepID=UPI001FFB22C7|nr:MULTISPECIES: methyl-accepting chemotaxis protein [unclassified Bradyrhizobium]MCK1268616.1 cache domain-containing protein [Bradyrhizobium sp. 84]MCK1370953.1 cache domain-containing protein [Bradyrhizobium sp. 49]